MPEELQETGTETLDEEPINGLDKAAIFLLTIGQEEASKVMQAMSPREVQVLGARMSSMRKVTRDMVSDAVGDFVTNIQNQTSLGVGSDAYLRGVLNKALGEDRAESVIDRILSGNSQGMEALKWMDARAVTEIVRFEHPQIIALVLSYLTGPQSAEVLSLLPENMRSDILVRIATLDSIPPQAIRELDMVLEKHVTSDANIESATLGGVQTAADILNNIGPSLEGDIMEQITEMDGDLGTRISDLMFVFDNLADVDDRGIQTLLREVSSEHLVLALKGASPELEAKILKNMSSRASEMLKDDMEAKGPVRLSEVEEAQKEILNVARRLEADGSIMLGGGEEML